MLLDTHCHLDFDAFSQDRDQVIERARAAGVGGILDPAIDLDTSREILALSQAIPSLFAAVGVHPNSAGVWEPGTDRAIKELCLSEKVLAIGEIGLDYYRDRAPQDLQREVFERQLALANECGLPVIIHSRNASANDQRAIKDILEILEEWSAVLMANHSPLVDRAGVLHSFSGDLDSAHRAIELGFYIGITGPVTFKNAPELQEIVAELPLDRLLIETDAPFLTPHPHRGKRNEPAYVRLVADKIAMLQHSNYERVAEKTSSNAERLFNWKVNH